MAATASQIPPAYSDKAPSIPVKETNVEKQLIAKVNYKSLKSFFHSLGKKEKVYQNYWHRLASETPQWTWNNKRCRAWLEAIAVWYLGYDEIKAKQAANRFADFGPTLLYHDSLRWQEIFVHRFGKRNEAQTGQSVHAL